MYTTTTPTMIKMIEIGLQKKRYTPHDNAQKWHRNGTDGQEIYGGGTVWLPPENSKTETNAIAIYYDMDTPCIAIVPKADIEAVMIEMNATLDTINDIVANAVDTVLSELHATSNASFNVDVAQVHPHLVINNTIKGNWSPSNLMAPIPEPEKLKRFFTLIVSERAHYRFESYSVIDHISFLHIRQMDGEIIAGGEVSIPVPDDPNGSMRTSFDLTLEPNTYIFEIYAYDFTGFFSITTQDTCTTEPERPHMYDENGFDIFGVKPKKLISLSPDMLTSDTTYSYRDYSVLLDGNVRLKNDDGNIAAIIKFSRINITLSTPTTLTMIRIAGDVILSNAMSPNNPNTTKLYGLNASNNWEIVAVLNEAKAPDHDFNWILRQELPASSPYQSYKIVFPENNYYIITELEVYE